jgi:hypothetical protein
MEKSISTLIRVDRHTTIFLTGSRATHWAVVTTGVVAECQISIDGDRRLTGFRLPGEAFGVEIERYSVTSEALTDCVISMFPTNVPAANSRLFAAMARQLNRVRNDHLLTTFRSVPERIAAFLVDLADRGMGSVFACRWPGATSPISSARPSPQSAAPWPNWSGGGNQAAPARQDRDHQSGIAGTGNARRCQPPSPSSRARGVPCVDSDWRLRWPARRVFLP